MTTVEITKGFRETMRYLSVGLEIGVFVTLVFAFGMYKFQDRPSETALTIVLLLIPILLYLISTQRGYELTSRLSDAAFKRLPMRVQIVAPYIVLAVALLVCISVALLVHH